MLRGSLPIGMLLATSIGITGCATQDVADLNKISLEHALVDTEHALLAAHAEAKRNRTYFGLYACSVTAVYNISATAGEDNKLSLSAAPPVKLVPINLSATETLESTASGTRANTVTVVLSNPACSSKTGGNTKPPPFVMSPTPPPARKE
jgi:hypothetical protein